MNANHEANPSDDRAADIEPARNRRRLVLGGSAASVLLSVRSGSALAEGALISPSAFNSITAAAGTSNSPTQFGTAHSHGYYSNVKNPQVLSRWPDDYPPDTTLAAAGLEPDVFSTLDKPATLHSVLTADGDVPIARNLIGIFLDAANGVTAPYLTVDDVRDMWDLAFTGAAPSGSQFEIWTVDQLEQYLAVLVGDAPNPYLL